MIDLTISTSNSQLAQLGGPHVKNFLTKKYSYTLPDLDNSEGLGDELSNKIRKSRERTISDTYKFIDVYEATSPNERAIKNVYKHMSYASDDYFSQCSEMSTITKYWSPIFESYFGEKRDVFIQWGDTLSVDCKNVDLNYRLDLRIITDTEKGPVEVVTGEFASTMTTNEGKLYRDKLKSVLASKCHLNSLLKKLVYLPQSQASNVHMPILQIMGQNISLYVLSLIDKQVYSVQNVMYAEYPRTLVDARAGGIKKIIDLLGHVEYMMDGMDGIEEKMKSYSRNTNNKMKDIVDKSKCNGQFEAETWTSSVEWDTCVFDE